MNKAIILILVIYSLTLLVITISPFKAGKKIFESIDCLEVMIPQHQMELSDTDYQLIGEWLEELTRTNLCVYVLNTDWNVVPNPLYHKDAVELIDSFDQHVAFNEEI